MLGPRRIRAALAIAASFSVTALTAAPALADKDGSGPGVLFYGLGSFAKIHGLQVGVGDGGIELDPLKGKQFRLEGGGHLGGAGFRFNAFVKGVRTGFDLSVFGVEGTKLGHDPLEHGFYVQASGGRGASFDMFLGYEILRGPVRPYIDVVGSFSGVSLKVDLMHPEFGRLGRSEYSGWLFGVGPRAGISVPFGKNGFFDLSGTYSLVGMERLRVVAGIGFWAR